jgi:hypothetical protein
MWIFSNIYKTHGTKIVLFFPRKIVVKKRMSFRKRKDMEGFTGRYRVRSMGEAHTS